jgi:ABC-type Na+ efflux pump permease subunit
LAVSITKGVIMAKKFIFVSGGILMLVLAYTLGASSVVAQSGEETIVGVAVYGNVYIAVTAGGDVYQAKSNNADKWVLRANVFGSVETE